MHYYTDDAVEYLVASHNCFFPFSLALNLVCSIKHRKREGEKSKKHTHFIDFIRLFLCFFFVYRSTNFFFNIIMRKEFFLEKKGVNAHQQQKKLNK